MFKYSSRFWLYAPISIFLLLAAAAMAHWWIVDTAFKKKLAALKGHEAVPGITMDWDKVEVGGFPFRIDADFSNFRAEGAGAHGPFAWKSEKFALHALTYGRRQIIYEAAGRQELRLTIASGLTPSFSFLAGSARASSINDKNGLGRFDLDVVDLGSRAFTIGRFQFHMRRDPDSKDLDLMVKLDQLRLGKGLLGLKAGDLSFYATLSQAQAWMGLLRGEQSWPQAARDWRAQGGTASLSRTTATGPSLLAPQMLLAPLY